MSNKDFETESFKFELYNIIHKNRFNIIQKSNNDYFGYIVIDRRKKKISYTSDKRIDLKLLERLIIELDSSPEVPFFI